jgi:hypothetical protein
MGITMTTTGVYQLAASSFSNVPTLWNQGFADLIQVTSPGAGADASFVAACQAVGASPIMNNSNDGSGGCGGQNCTSYYQALAAAGIQAVGGESEGAVEDTAIMNSLIFWNCGGEGTGGPTGNNNIWAATGGNAGAVMGPKGCASYLESYTSNSMISASELGQEAGYNKDAGCKEIGIMIGSWCSNDYGANADTYLEIADEYVSNGVNPAGFSYWYVEGDSSAFAELAMMQTLMETYTPIKENILTRFGDSPGPAPTPKPATPANFTWGINQLVGTQLTLVGSTYDAEGNLLPNAQINIDRASARGTTKNWTRMGSPVSNSSGAWRLTMPVASGPNFFWLVTADGKRGYWSNDMIYI